MSRWRLSLPRGRTLELSPYSSTCERSGPRVMGILNITPDSFSDGGLWLDPDLAVRRGLEMIEQGADMLDLGAESTRPGGGVYGDGAAEVGAREEAARLLPVLKKLRASTDALISVDTRKAEVAQRALEAGADLINDVGGLSDPELASVVADAGCPLILMHSRGEIRSMQSEIRFSEVAEEVAKELEDLVSLACRSGIDQRQLIVDPGIGFGKTAEQNLRLLGRLDRLQALGRPILVGASRKSFIAKVNSAPPTSRLGGSLAAAAAAAQGGAAILRVHDVVETSQFLSLRNAIDLAALNTD